MRYPKRPSFHRFKRRVGANKFNAKRSGGFDSQLERDTYAMLMLRQHAGEIRNLKRQQTITLVGSGKLAIRLRVDFTYELPDGMEVRAEAKGYKTPEWALKRKLYELFQELPLEIYVRGSSKGSVVLSETLCVKSLMPG